MPLVKLDDCLIFQSTPSVGRAPLVRLTTASKSPISIHALRGEGDAPQEVLVQKLDGFQSTPSVGRATV